MSTNPSNDYFLQKKALLNQCLLLSEELQSSLEDWEALSDILERRETAIQQLKELEETADKAASSLLTQDRKQELNQLIQRIQELDQNTVSLMRKEQQNIMTSLKTNTQGQKLMQYVSAPEQTNGRRLDYKK